MKKKRKKKKALGGSREMLEMLARNFKSPHSAKKPTKHRQVGTMGVV